MNRIAILLGFLAVLISCGGKTVSGNIYSEAGYPEDFELSFRIRQENASVFTQVVKVDGKGNFVLHLPKKVTGIQYAASNFSTTDSKWTNWTLASIYGQTWIEDGSDSIGGFFFINETRNIVISKLADAIQFSWDSLQVGNVFYSVRICDPDDHIIKEYFTKNNKIAVPLKMGAIDTDLMVVEKEDFSGQLITSNNEIRLGSKYTVLFTVFYRRQGGMVVPLSVHEEQLSL